MMGHWGVPIGATYSTKTECKEPTEEENDKCDEAWVSQFIRVAVTP
jgi:hypothetical protein